MKSPLHVLAMGAAALVATAAVAAEPAPAVQAPSVQAPSVQAMTKVGGVVSAVAGDEAMVTTADGKSVKVHLSAKTQLMLSTPADASAIKPGSYVGATNMDQTDGSGVSSEVHVMTGEGGPRPGINVPWGGGAMMTNGVVSKVAKSAKGPQLEINYGTGSKQVVVPGTTPIVVLSNTSDRSLVKPGVRVLAAGKADADGAVDAAYMTITPAGAAHAGH